MVNGNDILEHVEKCDECIKLEDIKGFIGDLIYEKQEECFNNSNCRDADD